MNIFAMTNAVELNMMKTAKPTAEWMKKIVSMHVREYFHG